MNKSHAVQVIAVIDGVLACIGILSETLSLTLLGENNFHFNTSVSVHNNDGGNQSLENGTDTYNRSGPGQNQPGMEEEQEDYAATPRFLANILLTGLIFGIFFMQLFMATTKLFVASKKMRSPLSALQKFSCWIFWSYLLVFLLVAMLTIAVYFSFERPKWTDWVLYVYLLIQIIFRVLSIYIISLYRNKIKINLIHPVFSIASAHVRHRPPPSVIQ